MTHVNAYFADVEEAKVKLGVALGELESAEARLAAKKLEDGIVEVDEVVEAEPEAKSEEAEVEEPKAEDRPVAKPKRSRR